MSETIDPQRVEEMAHKVVGDVAGAMRLRVISRRICSNFTRPGGAGSCGKAASISRWRSFTSSRNSLLVKM